MTTTSKTTIRWSEEVGLWITRERDIAFAAHARKYVEWVDPEHKIVVDLGATVGDYARFAAQAGAWVVHSWEMNPVFEEAYRRNTEGVPCSCYIHPTMVTGSGVPQYNPPLPHPIPGGFYTLQWILYNIRPQIIKMDIEGHEFEVLPEELDGVEALIVEFHCGGSEERERRMRIIHADLLKQGFTSEDQLPTSWPREMVYKR